MCPNRSSRHKMVKCTVPRGITRQARTSGGYLSQCKTDGFRSGWSPLNIQHACRVWNRVTRLCVSMKFDQFELESSCRNDLDVTMIFTKLMPRLSARL